MITTTQYWLMRAGLIVMFFLSGYAVGYGVIGAFVKHPAFIILALAGVGAYIFFLRLSNRLTVLWQRQQLGKLLQEAWDKALAEIRARDELK